MEGLMMSSYDWDVVNDYMFKCLMTSCLNDLMFKQCWRVTGHLRNWGFSLYLLPASLGTVFLVCGQQAHQNPGRMLHCVSWLSSYCCPVGTHPWVTYAPWFTSSLISCNNACVLLLLGWYKSTWDAKVVVVGVKIAMADFGTDCNHCFRELQLLLQLPQ